MDAKQIFEIVKRIFLTGASSGIGLAIAKLLVAEGHEVWGTSRNLERIPKMPQWHAVRLDLADPLSVEAAFNTALTDAGYFDVLINNAGAGHFDPAELVPMETIASQFQILVFGQIQLMQLALRHMQARGEGLIINVTSLASRLPVPFMAAYNAAKAAMASFTMSIQLELGNSRVQVVDLQPADIRTEFNQGVIKSTEGNPRYDTKIAKTWEITERNMKNAPTPDLVAQECSQISQLCSAAATYNSWRCISIKICASDFQISSATPSVVGIEEVLPDMTAISEAVILMAGEGSRLRGSDNTFLKPFVPLLGRPLISYALDALIRAGIKTVDFVVGYESERMIEQVKAIPSFRPQRVLHRKPRLAKTKWHFAACRRWPRQHTLSSHDERPSFRRCCGRSLA